MNLLRSWAVTVALAVICNAAAVAQEPPAVGGVGGFRSIRRPTTSPYLNLLQGRDLDMAIQYYGIVRPQQQFRGALNQQYRSTQQLQRQVDQQGGLIRSQNSQLGPTGHAVRFLDLGGYYGGISGLR